MRRSAATLRPVATRTIGEPIARPPAGRRVLRSLRSPHAHGRVALAGNGRAAEWIDRARALAEAAGARIEWTRSGETLACIERALADHDAVVVASRPAAAAADRTHARRFHGVVRSVGVLGSSSSPRSLRHVDRLLVGATGPSAASWEQSVRLACAWARDEGRERVHCAVRDSGWPILASDRALRLRRVAAEFRELEVARTSVLDVRRRLLCEPETFETVVADATDLDALVRNARAGVGGSAAAPALFVGHGCQLLDLDLADPHRTRSAEAVLAVALAMTRLLRRLGESRAASRLALAVRSELGERRELARDLWLDLASETPGRFLDALCARLLARHASR